MRSNARERLYECLRVLPDVFVIACFLARTHLPTHYSFPCRAAFIQQHLSFSDICSKGHCCPYSQNILQRLTCTAQVLLSYYLITKGKQFCEYWRRNSQARCHLCCQHLSHHMFSRFILYRCAKLEFLFVMCTNNDIQVAMSSVNHVETPVLVMLKRLCQSC